MFEIVTLSADEIAVNRDQLVNLLRDAVDGGASVSFLAPLATETAASYWLKVASGVASGDRIVLVARQADTIVGSVQLALASEPNAAHRAEVQKLLVHSQFRRQGIGQALMAGVEQAAREANRTLVVLDTQRGSPAERLYEKQGYTRAGIIPRFALSSAGTLEDTVLFYRFL
jgi:acetyltransferase